MSSYNSDCVEVFPTAKESSSSANLEKLVREISSASFEHVLPSLDRGIYIPKIGRRICSINQLTRQQCASLTENQLIQVFSFMANFPSALEAGLAYHRGQHQPAEEENSSSDHAIVGQLGDEHDTSSEVRNTPA